MATDVVHKESEINGYGKRQTTVVLSDGRVGSAVSGYVFGRGGDEAKALSRAIENARSKPVPKK